MKIKDNHLADNYYIDSSGQERKYERFSSGIFNFRKEKKTNYEDTILLFGDSYVFGVGLNTDENISSVVRSFNINCINYGIGAASNFLTERVIMNYSIPGDNVFSFVFLTYPFRIEYVDKSSCWRIHPHSKNLPDSFKDYYSFIENDFYSLYKLLNSLLFMQFYFESRGINYCFIDILGNMNIEIINEHKILMDLFEKVNIKKVKIFPKNKFAVDYVYDGIHYGPKSAKMIGTELYELYKNFVKKN